MFYDAEGCGEYQNAGDAKAANDPAPYPAEWTAEQRTSAYWYALGRGITVQSATGWQAVLIQAQREGKRHHDQIEAILTPPDEVTP